MGRCKVGTGRGNSYCGEFKGNAMEGIGVLMDSDGRYSGELQAGRRHGLGVQEYLKDGKLSFRFAGEYKMDKTTGLGTMQYTDGAKYFGEWDGTVQAPTQQGRGIYMDPKTSEMLIGPWHQGKPGVCSSLRCWNPSHSSFLRKVRKVEVRICACMRSACVGLCARARVRPDHVAWHSAAVIGFE